MGRGFCEGASSVHGTKYSGSFKASAEPAQDQDKAGITRGNDLHIGVVESLNKTDIIRGCNLRI